jgi:hypothetical protein
MLPHILLVAIAIAVPSLSQTANSDDALVGNWRGDSVCVVRPSACVDEKSLYHIKKLSEPNRYSLQADKIVNGEPVNMGTVDCVFAPEKQALTCELPKGAIHLALRGTHLQGTMHLADGTLWRNISLEKDNTR